MKNLLDKEYLKSIYKELVERWNVNKNTNHYQKINARFKNTLSAINSLDCDSSLNLLDIGCNNGILSVVSSQKFGTVTGVEFKEEYYRNALTTKEFFSGKGFNLDGVSFENDTLGSYLSNTDKNINAILACQVLYHLSNEDIDELLNILDNVKLFICSARKDKNKNNNRFDLFSVKGLTNFLIDNRFNIEHTYHKESNWPLFVATK